MPRVGEPGVNGKPKPLAPFWTTTEGESVRLYHGHVTDVLARLPEGSVQCVVTSPPYWGLRDYGTGTWEGGDPACDHKPRHRGERERKASTISSTTQRTTQMQEVAAWVTRRDCPKCGALKVDRQLGSEPSPDCGSRGKAQCGRCFVCNMVAVFRGVRRVLRDDGTLWLNLGDSYNGSGGSGGAGKQDTNRVGKPDNRRGSETLAQGNLVGVPWRVALALQADGWVLRQDVIWHKPAPMPESVRNRCTKAHEYVFLLTKSMRYFYDAEAIKERSSWAVEPYREGSKNGSAGDSANDGRTRTPLTRGVSGTTSNKRSVWTVATRGYDGAHFATFPEALVEPMIKAGTSEKGCCPGCGTPWRRVTEEWPLRRDRPNEYVKRTGADGTGNSCGNGVAGVEVRTTGWEPGCGCGGAEAVPCVVLDPFVGSGTTCCVAYRLGRRGWGIDLSEAYLRDNAVPRVEGTLLERGGGRLIPGKGGKPVRLGGRNLLAGE